MSKRMTSMERVLCAVSHKEPDRVPLMLLLSFYGAKERQISIKEYFSNPDLVAETQLIMQKKYQNDCLYSFSYASAEMEAFGGETIFFEDGPPNAGEPIIQSYEKINNLHVPKINECKSLVNVLNVTESLKREVADTIPIIGVVMSPFSLPIMQMGFEAYLRLLYFRPDLFDLLMEKNMEFCISWANAQLKAGATAICYFDPMASPTIIERDMYLRTGHPVACKVIPSINGPTATHLASGMALPVLDDLVKTKTAIVGISNNEKFPLLKEASRNKISLLGNLNGIDMINWSTADAEYHVKNIIKKAAKGGGFLISDCHGEIPYQVSEDVLMAISESVKKWGNYPLDWCGEHDE